MAIVKPATPANIHKTGLLEIVPRFWSTSNFTGKPAKSGTPIIDNEAASKPIAENGKRFIKPLTPSKESGRPDWLRMEREKLIAIKATMRGINE